MRRMTRGFSLVIPKGTHAIKCLDGTLALVKLQTFCSLIVPQPADTVVQCMAINKWVILIRHADTMAKSLG